MCSHCFVSHIRRGPESIYTGGRLRHRGALAEERFASGVVDPADCGPRAGSEIDSAELRHLGRSVGAASGSHARTSGGGTSRRSGGRRGNGRCGGGFGGSGGGGSETAKTKEPCGRLGVDEQRPEEELETTAGQKALSAMRFDGDPA